MKEDYKGYLIKCDDCGEYLEGSDGGAIVLSDDEEIVAICEAYDWKTTGQTHYCPECIEKQETNEDRD